MLCTGAGECWIVRGCRDGDARTCAKGRKRAATPVVQRTGTRSLVWASADILSPSPSLLSHPQIVELFYSTQPEFSYWFGCSSGGKQGLKELQTSPDTFDGVIAGAAAQWW